MELRQREGYSPYPYANGEEENPCVVASNDLLYWETPTGLANPIGNNEETGCDELKDPHILYRGDLDRLEVWYLVLTEQWEKARKPLKILGKTGVMR